MSYSESVGKGYYPKQLAKTIKLDHKHSAIHTKAKAYPSIDRQALEYRVNCTDGKGTEGNDTETKNTKFNNTGSAQTNNLMTVCSAAGVQFLMTVATSF